MAVDALRAEIAHNVAHLRAELAQIDDADAQPQEAQPSDAGLSFQAYRSTDLSILDAETGELVAAFYQSLVVVLDGHPGFLDANPDEIETAYRIVLESTIAFGEQLMARFPNHDDVAA